MYNALERMLAKVPDTYQKTIGFPTYDIIAAAALRAEETQAEIDAAKRKLDPANLSGAELDSYIYPRTGQLRVAATYATGVVTVTGNGTVTKGDLFESEGGIQFAATETVTVTGSADVPVKATTPGLAGNVAAGSINMMPVTIAGISAVSNSDTMTGGYEEETDAAYYARFLLRIQTPPTSGNVYHYMEWALEVAGVGAVQVYPLARGQNTVDVVIINTQGQPAAPDLVAAVQQHIDPDESGSGYGEAPIGAYCRVSSAEGLAINLSFALTTLPGYDVETVKDSIKAAVAAYLASTAFAQDYISVARIGDAIIDTDGVRDYENLRVNGGTANISIADRQVAVLGSVVIS